MLDPVLEKQLIVKGKKITVVVSDKVGPPDRQSIHCLTTRIVRHRHKSCSQASVRRLGMVMLSNALACGVQVMEYDLNFRMYFITRLPNPSFSPELQVRRSRNDCPVELPVA